MQGEYQYMSKENERKKSSQGAQSDGSKISSHIEINDGCFVSVEGCKGILRFGDEHILLNIGNRSLQILGTDLCICNMFSGTVCVKGNINSVEFLHRR